MLITEFYGDSPGGVETHVKGLERHLKAQGHELLVVTPNRSRWEWLIGSRPRLRSIYYFLKALPSAAQADAIYTVYTLSPFIAGVLLKLLFGTRLIGGIWNIEALQKIRASPFLTSLLKFADDVIFFTDAHKQLWKRGTVIPNWVDASLFSPGNSGIRKKLGWQKDFVVVFVGRPTKGKGLHTLMHAVAKIDCKLLVVGSFVDDAYFRKLAQDLQIGKRVHFTGRIPHGKLPDYYRAADVFCVPSTIFEGQGIVFIEAMACGKPIVTTNLPAVKDTVGNAAILVPPEDAKALQKALAKLQSDPRMRTLLSTRALRNSKQFAEEPVMRKYLKVLLK